MEYRTLGSTSVMVSRLGYGCAPFSGYDYGAVDEDESARAVRQAWECGINFFDVADVYGFGRAEELLSRALGGNCVRAVIATKCGLTWTPTGRIQRDASPAAMRRSVEASLRRLRCEIIPLLQLHWPDPKVPISESLGALAELQAEGKVRHIGVCNLTTEMLKAALPIAPIQSVQVPYNLLCRQAELELLTFCVGSGMSVLAHSGLARGFLSGKYRTEPGFCGSDTRSVSRYFSRDGWEDKQHLLDAMEGIAGREGRSCAAVALRWILDEGRVTCALAGIKSTSQLQANLQSIGWQLDSFDFEHLRIVSSRCGGSLTGELSGSIAAA